jgi:hypothetical protein
MRKINTVIRCFALISCIIGGLNVMAQAPTTEPKETKEKKEKAPEITFDKLVHDYGTIFEGDPGECEFVFKNTGKEPLVLSNVYSSCGCTIPSWPKDPIMPGKSSVIKVKYNTSRNGGINKTITVESNASENKRVELRIIGTVKKKEESAYPEKQPSSIQAEPAK